VVVRLDRLTASVWVDPVVSVDQVVFEVVVEVEVEVEDYSVFVVVAQVEELNRLEVSVPEGERDSTRCRAIFDWVHFEVAHRNLEAVHFEADFY
jgi:hypothetical protein